MPQPNASAPENPATAILAALTNMARQNTAALPHANTHSQASSFQVSNGHNNSALHATALNPQQLQYSHFPPQVNVPAPAAQFALQTQAPNHIAQGFPSNPNTFAGLPPVLPSAAALDPAIQHQLMIIKTLKEQGIPDDKIPAVLAAMNGQGLAVGGGGFPAASLPQYPVQNQNQNPSAQNGWASRQEEESRDRDHQNIRSPDRYRRRSRSRSPHRGWTAPDSPSSRRRDGPGSQFDYDRDSPGRNRGMEDRSRPGRANEYRQRSPPRRGRSPTPPRSHGGSDKWIGHDISIGKNNIKGSPISPYVLYHADKVAVLSRTLFVGGVT